MNIARHIALIDELCLRPFGAEHSPWEAGEGGPGYHVVVLERSHGDRATRAATVEQFEKYRDALYDPLAARWGDSPPWNGQTTLLRTEHEDIPAPWASLSARVRVAYVWEAVGTGRWVAVAVADRDETDDVKLIAMSTETAPP
ncbi:hypothetical protein [Streptomyces sp. NBC_01092]|uniref:hypothetical protein n=1 Tax=Streptomyces sp. NBC_01092 TaxID=2903748 RepID=UPI003868EB5C|nr:hypothetical protein OG254_07765 [Streptomyces sp. NBC_01092]